ncbi:carbohydrate kinase family protein [Curtobacterium sp. VKM Ac-2865]|uniref:carbohydrate kinase family protein n=1 Tax=Curtobacterium sp. VKM Ac-2865 TaxID=2783817 RepID=UPI00188B2DC0|nr:carbohydrate kinase family protein [Curtobacterium sp. VKM Ac-2865]MBF4583252.1 carbohydrate kinase family protein [Curtobacterium sp. VKM Ac-2865]
MTEAHAEPRPTGTTGGQADETTRGTLLFAGDVYCDVVFSGVTAPEQGAEVFADAFAITPGGVANRAVAAARAGAPTMLASRLGDDVLGRHVYDVLTAEPFLDTSLLELVPGHQSAVSVALTGPDDRSFITYEEHLGPTLVPDDLGRVAATHVGIAKPLPAWVARLRAAGTTVVGGVGWDHTGEWTGGVLDRLAEIDVFVPNDVEAMRYTRTDSALAAAKVLAERVPLAVVTRGPDGVVAVDSANGVVVTAETIRVEAVDPTGAGDVFVASFMAGVHHGWDLETRLRFAAASAAFAVTGLGGAASAPHPDELRSFLDQHAAPGDWSFLADVPSTDGH